MTEHSVKQIHQQVLQQVHLKVIVCVMFDITLVQQMYVVQCEVDIHHQH
jgi:hypothetical protein